MSTHCKAIALGPGIGSSAVNDSGHVAYTRAGEILLAADGETRAVTRAGEPGPEGGAYSSFGEVDLTTIRSRGAAADLLFFQAELADGPAAAGLFLWTPESLDTIALAGGTSPRGRVYRSFLRPTVEGMGGEGVKLAFVATMEDGAKSLIFQPLYGDMAPVEILATGDPLGEYVVEDFIISRMAFCLSAVATLRHPEMKKKVTREVIIIDSGFILHNGALQEKVKAPPLGRIRRILGVPAANFQDGFAAVELDGGVTALAQRTVFGESCVFAMPDATVQGFGPPVANSLPPATRGFARQFWVASVARLKGESAIWIGGFETKAPLQGEARLVRTSELLPDGAGLRSPALIKMNNRGELLFRGMVHGESGPREGLFLLDQG